jgi:hypothetical protein
VDQYERLITRVFAERFALELRKIPEAAARTPDFNVFAAQDHVAVLELKTLLSTAPIVIPGELTDDQLVPAGLRRDNCASRVASKIHDAVGQFEGVILPKVLVLLNDGTEADKFDLQESLRGFLTTEDGEPITTLPPDARQRAAADRSKVDLYVWVDESDDESPSLVTASAAGRDLRSRYFVGPPAVGAG